MVSLPFLSTLLVALPLLSVSAAPAPAPIPLPRTISDFCSDTSSGDQALWNELGVGDSFTIIASRGVDTGVGSPSSPDSLPKPWDRNVVRTLKLWTGGVEAVECIPLQPSCSGLTFTKENCNWVFFVLRSIEHYNSYLGKINDALQSSHGILTGLLPSMPGNFTNDGKPPPEDKFGDYLGIVQAVTGAASIAIPQLEPVDAGLGLFGALYDTFLKEEKVSPEKLIFQDYAGASGAVASVVAVMQDALLKVARKLMVDVPSNAPGYKYSEDPMGLVQILYKGTFAQDRTAEIPLNPPGMIGILASVAINWLWNSEKLIVVKTSPEVWGAPICDTIIWGENTWCTPGGAHAYTILGFAPYVIVTTGIDSGEILLDDPKDTVSGIENLGKFDLDVSRVVLSSEWAQGVTKKFRGQVPGDVLRDAFAATGSSERKELGAAFNLPFCDLEVLIPKNQDFMKSIGCELGKNVGDSGKQADCWKKAVSCLCGNLKDMDGNYMSDYDESFMDPSSDNGCKGVVESTLGQ